jgi:hypothetical protein
MNVVSFSVEQRARKKIKNVKNEIATLPFFSHGQKKETSSFIFSLTVNFRKTIPSLAAMKCVAESMSNH